MQKMLVAFDADRIKSYVFGTDKLKEVRGASALLDKLNRVTMRAAAQQFRDSQIYPIYTNGGQGLLVVISDKANAVANEFGQKVQEAFAKETCGGASVTYVTQPLPANLPDNIDELKKIDLSNYFRLIQIQMETKKGSPSALIATPSHPLMRLCDACGIRYAETKVEDKDEPEDRFYCLSCYEKQREDGRIKDGLAQLLKYRLSNIEQYAPHILNEELWTRITFYLHEAQYDFFPLVLS